METENTKQSIQTVHQIGRKLENLLMNFSENKVLLERELSFDAIVKSEGSSVLAMRQNSYTDLFKFVCVIVTDWATKFHPNLTGLTNEIAADLIETRDTWKAEDFIHFFKFIRQRQDLPEMKVYGQMSYEKLIAMLTIYEETRADALVKLHASRKGDFSENNKQLDELTKGIAEKIASKTYEKKDEVLGKQLEATEAKLEQERMKPNYKPPVTKVPDERYFEKTLLK